MRASRFLVIGFLHLGLLGLGASSALGDTPPIQPVLDELAQAPQGRPRLDAAKKLVDLGPAAEAELIKRLRAPRAATQDQLRALLKSIHADVPNAKGIFEVPARGDKPVADLDWLDALSKQPASPPVTDAIEVVAILRALAATRTEAAAQAILDLSFTPEGLVYRDESGRQLRAMSPQSLPTLLRASQDRKRDGGGYARYATYQLDRLSMNRPSYALAAAPNDAAEVAILRAIRDVKHPDAVTAVLDRVDAPSNAVRAAAREAWLAYVTGPEPPPAPKEFRKLPGGKKSKEKMPLYLTYRELADQELRRVLLAQTGTQSKASATPAQMTKVLFDVYDRRRAEAGDAVVRDAVTLGRAGQWDEVGKRYDALLNDDPLFVHRASMAAGYLEVGRFYAKKGAWAEAALAFDKVLSLDPDGEKVKEAESELAAARKARDEKSPPPAAKTEEPPPAATPPQAGTLTTPSGPPGSKGGGAPAPSAAPVPAAPPPAPAASATGTGTGTGASAATGDSGSDWLLYAGLGAGVLGVVLVVVATARRRRRAEA